MYLATLEVLGWWGGQHSPPGKELEMPFLPWRALLEGGRCFQMVSAGLLPSSGTACVIHNCTPEQQARFHASFETCLCLLKWARGSGMAPSLFTRCGVTRGCSCLARGDLWDAGHAGSMTALHQPKQPSPKMLPVTRHRLSVSAACKEVHVQWHRSLTLHSTFPITRPLPLHTPPSSPWVGHRRQLLSELIRTSYLKVEWLSSPNFCLLAAVQENTGRMQRNTDKSGCSRLTTDVSIPYTLSCHSVSFGLSKFIVYLCLPP